MLVGVFNVLIRVRDDCSRARHPGFGLGQRAQTYRSEHDAQECREPLGDRTGRWLQCGRGPASLARDGSKEPRTFTC